MKTLTLFVLTLFFTLPLYAQDGSDIHYIPENQIDTDLIGKKIHLDFFRKSFGNHNTDTISISINNESIRFVEVRNDNGYNNWFYQQSLLALDTLRDGKKISIDKMRILSISDSDIKVNLYISYLEDLTSIKTPYMVTESTFKREHINTVLASVSKPIRNGISIYGIYKTAPRYNSTDEPECFYCFEPSIEELTNSPIIHDFHIKSFDFETQTIELTNSGRDVLEELKMRFKTQPVVLTLNGEILYGLWFWNVFSSASCDRAYITSVGNLKINFGRETFTYGKDPRFHPKLKEYLETK